MQTPNEPKYFPVSRLYWIICVFVALAKKYDVGISLGFCILCKLQLSQNISFFKILFGLSAQGALKASNKNKKENQDIK